MAIVSITINVFQVSILVGHTPRHSSNGDVQDTYVLKSYNINVYIATFFPAAFDEISNFTLPFFDFTCQLVTNGLPVLYNNCSLCVPMDSIDRV